ncbi:MAG: pseudouridine synthase [Candidatus Pacebacteria bacterium]|nr:pseudouridine synthase [Candidatus Paceibacterota bacterium]
MRLNTYLRDQGYASRREADELIKSGAVFVNGTKATLGMDVTDDDTVEVRRKALKALTYLAYYKPRRLATQSLTEDDVIAQAKARGLFPVGRLDKDSEGLLLITNDGRLTTLLLGDTDIVKEYIVTVREPLKKDVPKIFAKGMETEAFGKLLPAHATIFGPETLRVRLVEGKKHQIRVMLADLGYTTTSLKRVRIGPVMLQGLRPGQDRPLTDKELQGLGVVPPSGPIEQKTKRV